MNTSRFSFPRRVRIHGGECGAVARALHHEAQKDALIPYERAFLSQADLGNVFGSTSYERKTMSIKTSIKRIALVAVSALGFGLLSVAPSHAANVGASPITLTAPTSPVAGATASVTVKGKAAWANTDAANIRGYLTSKPSSSANTLTATAGAQYVETAVTNVVDFTKADGAVARLTGTATGAVASATVTFGTFNIATAVAGDYKMFVWSDTNANGAVDLGEDSAEVSFTVAAANTTPSATYSTIEAWSVDAPTGPKAASSTPAGAPDDSIDITVKNTANAALYSQTIRAVVKGPGRVSLEGGAAGRDVTATLGAADNVATLEVTADGSAGSMTVDIYAGTTLLGTTNPVIWYGTLATLTATQKKSIIGKNVATASAVVVVGKDADGVVVPLAKASLVGTSSDTTVLATYAAEGVDEADGTITATITGANDLTTTSGRTATMTFKYLISGTTYATASALTFTIGGALKTVTAAFDKASYAPGEKVTATFTAKDASGNAAADGDIIAAGNLATTIASQGLTAAAVASAGGTKTITFYAPAVSGSFSLVGTPNVAAATAQVLATATVVNPSETAAEAAADAANEAIDAANAATDAANLAAEAADAATVAAEEARDAADAATAAVEELATQVATLMAALKAQITTLANTVAKIAKKVKA
jgi:trimeric autotransporter adhesin